MAGRGGRKKVWLGHLVSGELGCKGPAGTGKGEVLCGKPGLETEAEPRDGFLFKRLEVFKVFILTKNPHPCNQHPERINVNT